MSFTSSRLATHTIPQCFGTAGPLTPRLQTQMHGVRTKWTQFSSARLVGASVGRGAEAVRRLCGDLSHWVVRDPPALVILRSAPSSLAASPPPELAAFVRESLFITLHNPGPERVVAVASLPAANAGWTPPTRYLSSLASVRLPERTPQPRVTLH
jgi:hypothetical protein